MNWHSTYELLRHIADSWALLVMFLIFVVLAGWSFLPGGREKSEQAANMIFKDENDG